MNELHNLLESESIKPYLNINKFEEIELPFEYNETDLDRIINDFTHLSHPRFQNIKSNLINKTTKLEEPQQQQPPIQIPFISPRKSYELTQFNCKITQIYENTPFEFIIDVGAGNSNLSRLHKLPTIAIEPNLKAQKVNKRLNGLMKHSVSSLEDNQVHYTKHFELNDEDTLRFIRSRQRSNSGKPKCLIIGLDTCGDLSGNIIDLVVKSPSFLDVIGCLFVPCCFHKVTKFISLKFMEHDVNFKVFGTSDLRALDNQEIIKRFEVEQDRSVHNACGIFIKWCFVYGFLSHVIETLVIQDRIELLKEHNHHPNIDIIFHFDKSSRNIAINCTT
ncbi:hypothetical protein BN7_5854 [Wickerhamomyces ciferrii]|uniref:Methyltransferase domain-containing protein n=1 Tax=Wickerhamomyces ciferrii (strain ATCC 14091 / BCRC 22168 / CBS 111 / JCM 3599 / NBRC 0793 / NRRL Y-1031 F-60-10) TaxID=1206466 RepID=K0KWD2_WICCF|nr:uncharacterized protein BN7_5854 [Wickerhamomyces ciferrii]CCH46262.1 hypothetical protein BN7_5854 [Wickerhamomyces ciferrii]